MVTEKEKNRAREAYQKEIEGKNEVKQHRVYGWGPLSEEDAAWAEEVWHWQDTEIRGKELLQMAKKYGVKSDEYSKLSYETKTKTFTVHRI